MFEYLALKKVPRRWFAAGWVVLVAGALWGLLCLYGTAGAGAALGMAAVYAAAMPAGVRMHAFAARFITSPQRRATAGTAVFALSIALAWGLSAWLGWYDPEAFPRLIPLLLIGGGTEWIGLHFLLRSTSESAENSEASDESVPPERREPVDRISVKKGAEIHIVRVEELLYVQAEGDYVMLFTPAGRFLKEQTMRWFEEHLPDRFVRIHRSCIVDVDRIARVELFGKETYRVRLQDGTLLKASVNGYRQLRLRLQL